MNYAAALDIEEAVVMMMPEDAAEHLVMLDTCGKRPMTAMETILVGHIEHLMEILADGDEDPSAIQVHCR